MNPQFRKVALIAASLGLLLSLFLALRPDGDEDAAATTAPPVTTLAGTTLDVTTTTAPATTSPAEPTTIAIVVADGRPTGGIQRVTLSNGERAVLVVSSDVVDEVHLHGYDLRADLEAGGSIEIRFTATTVGRFEVELEQRGVQLAEIEVQP